MEALGASTRAHVRRFDLVGGEGRGEGGDDAINHQGGDATADFLLLSAPLFKRLSPLFNFLGGNQTLMWNVAAPRASRHIEALIIPLAQLRKLMHN